MTKVGEGPEAERSRPVMTFGAPTVGEVLADRYRLEEHINDDAVGRQVWRGVDVILRRPVAVVLRYPGGDSAIEMLDAAVAASRVIHPNLVGVYDAIDEDDRAYVVREWVEGAALRDHVARAPLDADRATAVGYAVAGAVAAMHATGMVHNNIHPGTVLIAQDGRVVLADARVDDEANADSDARSIGGILYFSLTGHWPQAEAGRTNLPDAVRDSNGALAAPRRVRGGVPGYLNELTADLLDPRLTPPSADVIAAELGRLHAAAELANEEQQYDDTDSPLGFGAIRPNDRPRPAGRKMAVGVVALLLVAVAGLLVGAKLLTSAGAGASNGPNANTSSPPGTRSTDGAAPAPLKVGANQVRIVDAPKGDRTEVRDAFKVVDGDQATAWETQSYRNRPDFGGLKNGMGILIDLGQPRFVGVIQVNFSAPGATADVRVGERDPDPNGTPTGDDALLKEFKLVGAAQGELGVNAVFPVELETRYILLWITRMPPTDDGRFKIGVQEIIVHAR